MLRAQHRADELVDGRKAKGNPFVQHAQRTADVFGRQRSAKGIVVRCIKFEVEHEGSLGSTEVDDLGRILECPATATGSGAAPIRFRRWRDLASGRKHKSKAVRIHPDCLPPWPWNLVDPDALAYR